MTNAERTAYYTGRTEAFRGYKIDPSPFPTAAEREEYKRGYRHAVAEERLSNDTEWDD